MKLKLKHEFLEWSINCGGRNGKRKLKNIHPSEFEKLFLSGYKDFFEVCDTDPSVSRRDVLKPLKNTKLSNDNTEPTAE